jgi:hypothetical protein
LWSVGTPTSSLSDISMLIIRSTIVLSSKSKQLFKRVHGIFNELENIVIGKALAEREYAESLESQKPDPSSQLMVGKLKSRSKISLP